VRARFPSPRQGGRSALSASATSGRPSHARQTAGQYHSAVGPSSVTRETVAKKGTDPELIPYQLALRPTPPPSALLKPSFILPPPSAASSTMLPFRTSSLVKPVRQRFCLRRLLATSTAPPFEIPCIDFARFRLAATKTERNAAAAQIVDALITAGFMVCRHVHPIPLVRLQV
jgi:hypothetical protein